MNKYTILEGQESVKDFYKSGVDKKLRLTIQKSKCKRMHT